MIRGFKWGFAVWIDIHFVFRDFKSCFCFLLPDPYQCYDNMFIKENGKHINFLWLDSYNTWQWLVVFSQQESRVLWIHLSRGFNGSWQPGKFCHPLFQIIAAYFLYKISFESLLNPYLVLSLKPECRKWHFGASGFQHFLGEHVPDPSIKGRDLTAPEVLQLPTLIGSAAYFRT